MIKRILVVDDDIIFRTSILRSLEMADFEVIQAGDGKEALELLETEKVDLILSDVKMPNLNGIEFLHRLKRDKPDLPFILMTGFSEVIEIKEAYEIGANGFLAKPYRESDLLDQIIKIDSPEEDISAKAKYIGIFIDEFVAGASIKYPIFIKLCDDTYIKIANQGENLSAKQVEAFREKGTRFFYLEKDDFKLYIDFNLTIKASILRSTTIPPIKKLKYIKILLNHHNKILTLGELDEDLLKSCLELKEDAKKLLKESNASIFQLNELSCEEEAYVDCYSVSFLIALTLSEKLDWMTDDVESDLMFGSMFQNLSVGFSLDEHGKDHTLNSSKIISASGLFRPELESVILHHHEYLDGTGYPSGITGTKINAVANLINFTNFVVNILNSDMDFGFINFHGMTGLFKNEFIEIFKSEIESHIQNSA